MSVEQRAAIGFDRRIDIEWLDAAAGRLADGHPEPEVRKFLWSLLDGVVAGETVHSARGKTLTVLSRIWVTVPKQSHSLRDASLEYIPAATADERLAMHWAMSIACYPFFRDVAENVGKLLALHGEARLAQVTRRMTETWGDRSTLPRATQRVIRSMIQWGTLRERQQRNEFTALARRIQVSDGIAELLIRAALISEGHGMALAQVIGHSAFFPFNLQGSLFSLRCSPNIRVLRQGDQTDFVELTAA